MRKLKSAAKDVKDASIAVLVFYMLSFPGITPRHIVQRCYNKIYSIGLV